MSKEAPVAEGRIHEFVTKSGADTVEVGRKLVNLLAPPQLLILRGDLGTGKTTLVKGIAQALDAAEPDEVTSPTFTLLHEYDGIARRQAGEAVPPGCVSAGRRAATGDTGAG